MHRKLGPTSLAIVQEESGVGMYCLARSAELRGIGVQRLGGEDGC